jgi:ubiquinone/menaquinone biosynthesis C-methylase UbiE
MIKINLGSGYNLIPDFINVDLFTNSTDKKIKFVKADIKSLPFKKDYADYILCDNVLEHLPQSEVPDVLHEIKRVLKPGGQAIVVVPDFHDIAQQWLNNVDPMKFDWTTYKFFSEIIFGNQIHEGEYHKSAFYPAYISYIMHMVGLHNFELIMVPRGLKTSALKEFEGLQWNETSVIRNTNIIIKITK